MKGYWHEIGQENINEMCFREGKVCIIAIHIPT